MVGRVQRTLISGGSTFVVGLSATLLVGLQVAAGRSETVPATVLAVGGIGALCAVIGVAADSQPEALLAGVLGLVVAVVQLQDGSTTAPGTAFIAMVLAIPYLAGFIVAVCVTKLLPGDRSPGAQED